MIQAIFNAINKVLDSYKITVEHQSEQQIIEDKRKHKKATDIAEKIILIAQKYIDDFVEKDRKLFEKLVNQFYKYN